MSPGGRRAGSRSFAVELNNGTWDLIDNGLSEHSPRKEQEQALYAAYAAAHHWMLIAEHPAAFADWDRAFAAEAIARVASLGGRTEADRLKAEARRLAEAVEHPEERRICTERLTAAPW